MSTSCLGLVTQTLLPTGLIAQFPTLGAKRTRQQHHCQQEYVLTDQIVVTGKIGLPVASEVFNE
jgi:hypothetical protein